MKILQIIKTKLFGKGPGQIGSSLSSNGPAVEHNPPVQPAGFSIEPDPEALEQPPEIGVWRRLPNGDRVRTIRCSSPATGSEMVDEPKPPRQRIVSINDPFRYDKKDPFR